MSVVDKIKEIEDEMARTQKNKATAKHLGLLKAKIAKYKRELLEGPRGSGKKGAGIGFDVSKSGDSRIGLVGFPSVGKSTLLNKLTSTSSEVAEYEFTTLTCIPGVLYHNGSRIQLLDLPGIIEGAKDGKGRGRQVIAVAQTCDLIVIVLDCLKPMTHKRIIENELEGFGIRLNKTPPNIYFKKKEKGGLAYSTMYEQEDLDIDIVKSILAEYKIHHADVSLKQQCTVDDLIDAIEANRRYIPCIYALNKIDQITIEELDVLYQLPHCVPVCAHHNWNLDALVEMAWDELNLVRIYTKPRGQIPDYSRPIVISRNKRTVEDLCHKIHKGLIDELKYAIVWGKSVKYNPQRVGKDHVLEDEDIVQIVK